MYKICSVGLIAALLRSFQLPYRYRVQSTPSSQSLATRVGFTATVGMYYGPKIILYELQTQAAL